MKLTPGSTAWLLRHELRLFYFRMGGSSKGAARRGPPRAAIAFFAIAVIALHWIAWKLMRAAPAGDHAAALAMPLTIVCIIAFTMMMSQSLRGSIEALFERGDLDLLLSSPLPSRSIFAVRLAAIAIGTATLYLFLLGPFANVGLALGRPRWLAVYPVVLAFAAVAASLSMLLTLGLVRLLGIRRTRVVAQVLGALSGAFIFLSSQIYGNGMGGARNWLSDYLVAGMSPGSALGWDSILWLPGRAVLGAPLPIVVLALAGAAAFLFTVSFTHGFFVRGVQQAVSLVKNAAPPANGVRYRFGRSLATTVLLKEWRLIVRDPQLISLVLLQLLYLLPLCFMLTFKASNAVPGIAASIVFICTSLTGSLGWLIMAAEDAPDLLRLAPAPSSTIAGAKCAAAVIPAALLLLVPLAWLAARAPLAAMFLALCALGATASSTLIVMWCARPAARGEFRNRGKGNVVSTFLEFTTAACWTGLTWLALSLVTAGTMRLPFLLGTGALCAIILVLLTSARFLRQRPA